MTLSKKIYSQLLKEDEVHGMRVKRFMDVTDIHDEERLSEILILGYGQLLIRESEGGRSWPLMKYEWTEQ